MLSARPYVSYEDVKAICPFLDQLPSDDEFLVQRVSARNWLDAAIAKHLGITCWGTVCVDTAVTRVCAYRAASEILAMQITPTVEQNAYEKMADKFQRMAESEISTLVVRMRPNNSPDNSILINLGVSRRGKYE